MRIKFSTFSPQMKWFLFKLDALLKEHQVCLAAGRDGGLVTQSPLKSIKDDQYLAKFYPEEIPRDIGRNYTPPIKLIDWKTQTHKSTPRPLQLFLPEPLDDNGRKVTVFSKDTNLQVGHAFDFFIHNGDLYGHHDLPVTPNDVAVCCSSEVSDAVTDSPEYVTWISEIWVSTKVES